MKILFIPCHIGGYAHFIPLLVLNKMLEGTSHSTAFLLSKHAKKNYSVYYKSFNIEVLDVDYTGTLNSAKQAYSEFKPDIIVDDFSLSAGFLCQVRPVARITIQRTGIFPFEKHLKPNFKHSSSVCDNKFADVSSFGLQPLQSLSDLFDADIKIVPGIPSLEVLPLPLQNDPTYYFSGPLLLNDSFINPDLQLFFEKNRWRKKVYLTYGSAQNPPTDIYKGMEYILSNNMALVSNVECQPLQQLFRDTYYYEQYLPMHFVCSSTDLVIHHCGSATYHYPILHKKATVTLGTQCYDREDVALRLRDMSISKHISSPAECSDFLKDFKDAFETQFYETDGQREERMYRQQLLKKEIEVVKESFDFNHLLNEAVFIFKARKKSELSRFAS